MKTVQVKIDSDQKSSRLELFVRIVWFIPTFVVLWIFSIVAGICLVIQILFILITGRRQMALNDVIRKYIYYVTKVNSYFNLITDERSPILPED